MNQLCTLLAQASDGSAITLEKNAVYHVREDDSLTLTGIYCTNTASRDENPNGLRRTAVYLKDKKQYTDDVTRILHR